MMGTNPSNFVGDPNRPVESISWFDAVNFCNAWSLIDGLEPVYVVSDGQVEADFNNGYRLPTEAEWEYACRAGSNEEFFWGQDEKLAAASWFDSNSEDTTHAVGTKRGMLTASMTCAAASGSGRMTGLTPTITRTASKSSTRSPAFRTSFIFCVAPYG